MRDSIWYHWKNQECELALEEFREINSVPAWLEKHMELFLTVTMQPEGRPRIADIHLGDETFEKIRDFASLFEKVYALFI